MYVETVSIDIIYIYIHTYIYIYKHVIYIYVNNVYDVHINMFICALNIQEHASIYVYM